MFPTLNTKRLLLREIVNDDVQDVYNVFANENVTRFYGQEPLTSLDQAKQFIEFFAQSYNDKRGIRWGIELKEEEKLIGTIGFNALSLKHKRAEIGYELHPDYWRRGYATEAASEVMSYGFNKLYLNRIGAIVFLENTTSSNLLTKLGFEKEGVLRNYMCQNDRSYDVNMFSILKP
ncbi:GNAT family N-acetyltransferase [Bacillus solimangrovi]|uniref:GNAT family N-acetyltransferase n=1 Tax=Bacillus solimangrovi TaxID=1305675 RepID=A0A1E5LJA1_9BACI|nr:GNAT family protein [Bacillus solimangrovi]OEH94172.1 GNAT family N-acetyltransferase [Bacillus solimangrovi]